MTIHQNGVGMRRYVHLPVENGMYQVQNVTANRRRMGNHTCKAQADAFKSLLEAMSERPQDYVITQGRMTTKGSMVLR